MSASRGGTESTRGLAGVACRKHVLTKKVGPSGIIRQHLPNPPGQLRLGKTDCFRGRGRVSRQRQCRFQCLVRVATALLKAVRSPDVQSALAGCQQQMYPASAWLGFYFCTSTKCDHDQSAPALPCVSYCLKGTKLQPVLHDKRSLSMHRSSLHPHTAACVCL